MPSFSALTAHVLGHQDELCPKSNWKFRTDEANSEEYRSLRNAAQILHKTGTTNYEQHEGFFVRYESTRISALHTPRHTQTTPVVKSIKHFFFLLGESYNKTIVFGRRSSSPSFPICSTAAAEEGEIG